MDDLSNNKAEISKNEYYNLETSSELNSVNESIDGIDLNESNYSTNLSSYREMDLIKPKKRADEIVKDLNKLNNKYDSQITVEKEDSITRTTLFDPEENSKFFRKIGSMYAFWFDYRDNPRIVIGPHCK